MSAPTKRTRPMQQTASLATSHVMFALALTPTNAVNAPIHKTENFPLAPVFAMTDHSMTETRAAHPVVLSVLCALAHQIQNVRLATPPTTTMPHHPPAIVTALLIHSRGNLI